MREILARLQVIVAERATWEKPLAQVKRMQHWVLDAEHILDGSWVSAGEVASTATVGQRLDTWREQMARSLTEGTLSELEQTCLISVLQVLSNLRPYLVQCYDLADFPRTVPRHGTQHSRPQDPVSSHQWSQELERVSVALRALCGLRGLVEPQ